MRRPLLPGWFVAALLIALGTNALAGFTTRVTIGLMRAVSDFAVRARDLELHALPYYRALVYPLAIGVAVAYLWPLVQHFRRGAPVPAPLLVQRRVINAPMILASIGFLPWLVGLVLFPALTFHHFQRWSGELMSQQVLSPLVNGFLAATTTYLLTDLLFRARVAPRVFPEGHIAEVSGARALGVRARLVVFLIAVAFVPLFTVLGLVRAAAVRVAAGMDPGSVVATLTTASQGTFIAYVAIGVALTLLLARSLTDPLGRLAAALRRVQQGDLSVKVPVSSADEVGILEDGVNQMIAALSEKERILQTFGRVVEPSVRDRLLAGELKLGGELRFASVMFCDLRGFTAIAEREPPAELVATLNEFFTTMATWVRQCSGFVDKFVGDALLVVFGLFERDSQDARAENALAAIRCALGMQDRLAELNSLRALRQQPPLAMSVGIHTGEVIAGTIGAEHRLEYTVIGDTVNVAARLTELCKERGCSLLVSEGTYQLARSNGFTGVETMRDSVALRGRSEAVLVIGLG